MHKHNRILTYNSTHTLLRYDFKFRFKTTTCRALFSVFMNYWDTHKLNEHNKSTFESQNGKNVIELIFVSSRFFSQVLTKHKPVIYSVELKGKLQTLALRGMKIRKIEMGKLSKAMKEVQKPTAPSEINNLFSHFTKFIYESAFASTKRRSQKWFNKEFYVLHKQLKAENRHRF